MAEFTEGWPQVQGSAAVHERFGGWPSFHDAEVRRLTLDCTVPEVAPTLELVIYVFQTLPRQVDSQGYLVQHNQTLLTLRFTRVTQLKLEEFNHQNQLSDLLLNDIRNRQWQWGRFEVGIRCEFGIDARFYCEGIAVTAMEPFRPMPQVPDGRGRALRSRPLLPEEP